MNKSFVMPWNAVKQYIVNLFAKNISVSNLLRANVSNGYNDCAIAFTL